MNPAVFLDRDGVLNRATVRGGKPYPPATMEELQILPGVPEALNELKAAGYRLLVVTNQPDVARGLTTKKLVDEMNSKLESELPLDAILTCFHDTVDRCDCRKPKPGLLIKAAREWSVDLSASFVVGDRWRDVEAGRLAGCRTIYIDYGYDEQRPEKFDFRVDSLAAAAKIILKGNNSR